MKKENKFDFLDPDPKKDDTTSSLLVSILFGKNYSEDAPDKQYNYDPCDPTENFDHLHFCLWSFFILKGISKGLKFPFAYIMSIGDTYVEFLNHRWSRLYWRKFPSYDGEEISFG